VIVANLQSLNDENKLRYIDCFVRLIKGAHQASQYVMLTANVPTTALEEAKRIIGGSKGASCSNIKSGWFALQSIVLKTEEHKIIFDLLQIGVTDIIVNRDIPMIMS